MKNEPLTKNVAFPPIVSAYSCIAMNSAYLAFAVCTGTANWITVSFLTVCKDFSVRKKVGARTLMLKTSLPLSMSAETKPGFSNRS